jgi:hypothetical protein
MYWIIFLIIIIVLCILYFCISKVGSGIDPNIYFPDDKYKKEYKDSVGTITSIKTNISIIYRFVGEVTIEELEFTRAILNNKNDNIEKILDLFKTKEIKTRLEIISLDNIPFLYIILDELDSIFIKYSTSNTCMICWDSEENRILEPFDDKTFTKIEDIAFIIKMPELNKFDNLQIQYSEIDPNCEISFLKYYIPFAVYIKTDTIYNELSLIYSVNNLSYLYEHDKITVCYKSKYCNIPIYTYQISDTGKFVGTLIDYTINYEIIGDKIISTPNEAIDYESLKSTIDKRIDFINSLFACIRASSITNMHIIRGDRNTVLFGRGFSNGHSISFQFNSIENSDDLILTMDGVIRDQIRFTNIVNLRKKLVACYPLIFQLPIRSIF